MREILRQVCRRVGKKAFVRGMSNGFKIVAVIVLALIVWSIASCERAAEKGDVYRIYEVVETQVVVESSKDNAQSKKPVFVEDVKFIVAKEKEE